ncbi:PIG-L family deacetylase [Streptomyces sp. NPDC060334]|uniref:PIG-L family deacetylase n=1 Tax=Streptomyces sp. NPDC060334 TaxID=3347099 RepID=UPI003652FC29
MGYTSREEWQRHFADGMGFRRLGDVERALLAEHAPAPDGGGRALEVGCGTGELAVHLSGVGYVVDAADFTDSALARARAEHPDARGVRWLRLDVERDDPAPLDADGYDLIVMRLVAAFLRDRSRVLHGLGQRLRPGGALVVITPTAENTPAHRRDIALDEGEIRMLGAGWQQAEQLDADGLAVLVLRGPGHVDTTAVEMDAPPVHAQAQALAVVTDDYGRVLLGRSERNMWELPGGKTVGGEDFAAAAVREPAEGTGLVADPADAYVVTLLADVSHGAPRLTAVVRITAWSGTLSHPGQRPCERWEFHDLHALACLGRVFTPAATALDAIWPGVLPGLPPVHAYPLIVEQPPLPMATPTPPPADREPPSVLGVFAHPDDESLLAGGVLARHAAAGARTAVVTATWAPDGPRAAELARALSVLGAGEPRMLGFRDARAEASAPGRPRWCDTDLDEAIGHVVAHIRQFRPDIVITHDAVGQLTGHPDHRRTHQVALLAVEAAGLAHLHPEAGEPWQPGALYAATHPHSGIGDLGPLLSGVGKSLLSVPDAYATGTVDVTRWLDRKWAAITCHRSQLQGERPLPALLGRLDEELRSRILGTEYFTRLCMTPDVPGLGHLAP